MPDNVARRRYRFAAAALGAATVALSGCFADPPKRAFEDIAALPSREEFVEIELGDFVVPIPIILQPTDNAFRPDNLMQVEFGLFIVVEPRDEKLVKRLKDRNEGRIHDSVIRVCRNTARDDLLEAQKSTLKAHLLDAVQPYLGGEAVRRVGLNRVILDEL
ncbi:hypothetical protein [Botrimarina mediterranea]|uniref:Flagellar protein FliL n=1 Tax=Botrimarina mediterranea TaxID=2528022 RepID=A0A518KEG3_9BACT|nr:hypothetical protein [Botrimarina mediterranea]QDV76185.1 hypothetical protein Spa11_44100 [Botrimarina mediterranea]QDV80782.1 hypothetical protein K2D_44120 [Planctomycetes bacterium K2D]